VPGAGPAGLIFASSGSACATIGALRASTPTRASPRMRNLGLLWLTLTGLRTLDALAGPELQTWPDQQPLPSRFPRAVHTFTGDGAAPCAKVRRDSPSVDYDPVTELR
jgi:hypothetical protein